MIDSFLQFEVIAVVDKGGNVQLLVVHRSHEDDDHLQAIAAEAGMVLQFHQPTKYQLMNNEENYYFGILERVLEPPTRRFHHHYNHQYGNDYGYWKFHLF